MHTGGDTSATALQTALRNAGLAADDHAAADLLHRLREQTGLLARLSEAHTDRYLFLFSHMTLREYLVAMRLHNAWQQDARRTWRFLKLRLHLPDWREPLALLAGLLDEADAQRLLTWIVRARSPEERHLHRDLLLAAKLAVESGHAQIMRGILVPRLLRVLRGRRVGIVCAKRRRRRWGGSAMQQPCRGCWQRCAMRMRWVREAAAAALGRIGAPAVPGLLAALRDADARRAPGGGVGVGGDRRCGRRAGATGSAARCGCGRARAAAAALGRIGDAAAVPGLLAALRDADARVRRAAAEGVGADRGCGSRAGAAARAGRCRGEGARSGG
jgi:hypothetical protein